MSICNVKFGRSKMSSEPNGTKTIRTIPTSNKYIEQPIMTEERRKTEHQDATDYHNDVCPYLGLTIKQ